MEPIHESVVPDPQRRYQSMLATVSILNQARKTRRRTLASLTNSSTPSVSASSSLVPTDRSSTKVKMHWQAAVSKAAGKPTCADGEEQQPGTNGDSSSDAKKHAQNSEVGKTAVSVATTGLALKRKKLRKWRNDRKRTLYLKFRRVAWIAILVRRICRMHYIDVSNATDLSFAQVSSSRDSIDVMFDVTQFRAKKQKLLSQEAKRILRTSPEKRTAQEIYYVQIAIRQLQAIAGYPVRMQKSLSQVCWYEAYGPTRVIIREGHPPRAFYFIYSGSVVVTVLEPGRLTQRTVAIMRRGDSFGELAILNHGSRTSTITAREDLQLIVISAEDFMKIFMSGGVKRLTDPDHLAFIRSIDFLKGWPIQLLDLHPKQCVYNFFRRDTVLVRDSKYSDWIYIVKSGSCSVVIRLGQGRTATKLPPNKTKKGSRKNKTENASHHMTAYRHEARLVSRENSFLRGKARLLANARPDLFHRGLELPVLVGVPERSPGGRVDASAAETETTDSSRISSESLTKGCDRQESVQVNTEQNNRNNFTADELQGAYFGPRRTFADDLNAHRVQPISGDTTTPNVHPVFVCVRTLVKGGAFGLAELMFSDQPSVSLISNGAECVVLSKRFFLEHAQERLIHQIMLLVSPYGSVDELQVNLEKELSWQQYRDNTLRRTVDKLRTERAALNKASHSF